ncbi:MAG TPA: hypothetical protein VNK41_01560 [Vicinamibacterales bacterium]|nr:hypothetical protein [Vicinamibacterales bacterium]
MATHTRTETYAPPAGLGGTPLMMAAAVGIVALGAAFLLGGEHFYKGYLLAILFWTGASLGCLALLMVQHLSGGAWGVVTRRIYEAAGRTLPLMALLFVPIALGLPHLFEWANPEAVAADPILQHKQPYLNVPFFLARAVIFFVVWSALALALSRWSRRQDDADGVEREQLARKMQRLSGGGLVAYAVTAFFMSVDWVMSLDPHWFSTIYGMLFMVNQGLSGLALTIALLILLARHAPMSRVVAPAHLHDLGKLLLAFVMLWAYLTFSQFLIVWSANLPEEIPWYLTRWAGGWRAVSVALIVCHFIVPFLLLLNRDLKRRSGLLALVAVWILVMRFVDLFWLIGPLHGARELSVHAADFLAPIGVGGLWAAMFLRQLKATPLLPLGEPELQGALEHGRHAH